tara:strand:- start:102 stop:986 length:885 start_codon:yes stop_codon:yes gene_type:complete
MLTDDNIEELKSKGYTVVKNIINDIEIQEYEKEFNNWLNSNPDIYKLHDVIEGYGIFKFYNVGHQRFAWLLRTNQKIQEVFKKIWNCDELVTSFDGCGLFKADKLYIDRYWTHSDQSYFKKGLCCVQSFVSLTDNEEKTFIVYEGSHLLHESYCEEYEVFSDIQWTTIYEEYTDKIKESKKVLKVDKGDLVLWDSRTFHQNTSGKYGNSERRLVQYLCFLPKNNEENTIEEKELRKYFFDTKTTTTHFPYPMNYIPKQPTHYNLLYPESSIYIDYDKVNNTYIDDLIPEIEKIL